jgi:ABC-type uncharacterized transport system substrate-binding protein
VSNAISARSFTLTPRLRVALLVLWAGALACVEARADVRVLLVTSERGGPPGETLAAIRAALAADVPPPEIATLELQQIDGGSLAEGRIIVTVGARAARAVAEKAPRQPVLHTLLPTDAYESLPPPSGSGPRSAIFLDQPAQRQIALIVEALPESRQLALLAGPHSEALAAKLVMAAQQQQLGVMVETVSSDRDLYPALQRLLSGPAVLVALPDSTVFNSYTIQNVLLTSYRHRAPLIGFSLAYVRAGALLGLYSTPAQIGEQAADAIRMVLAGNGLPPPQAPRRFEIAINENVAHSLGITLGSAAELTARVMRRESNP